MSRSIIVAVARWEYKRYAKPRDLVIGTLVYALLFGIVGFVGEFAERKRNRPREIAVSGAARMGLQEVEALQHFRMRAC